MSNYSTNHDEIEDKAILAQRSREEGFMLGVFVGLGDEFREKPWNERRDALKKVLPYLTEEQINHWLSYYR